MKKSQREARAERRREEQHAYEAQEVAVADFLTECRAAMPDARYREWLQDVEPSAGDSLDIFTGMVCGLRIDQTPVTPSLRKAIERVLIAHGLDHAKKRELSDLNVGAYWVRKYREAEGDFTAEETGSSEGA